MDLNESEYFNKLPFINRKILDKSITRKRIKESLIIIKNIGIQRWLKIKPKEICNNTKEIIIEFYKKEKI